MLKMVDGTGIIGVDMVCPLGGAVSPPQPPNFDKVEVEGVGSLMLPNSLKVPLERVELIGNSVQGENPAPDNPQEIKSAGRKSKNLFNKNTAKQGYEFPSAGSDVEALKEGWFVSDFMPVKAITYCISGKETGNGCKLYNKDKVFVKNMQAPFGNIKFDEGIAYFRINGEIKDLDKIQVEEGTVATDYEPYGYFLDLKVTGKNLFDQSKLISGFINMTTGAFEESANTLFANSLILDKPILLKSGQTLVTSVDNKYAQNFLRYRTYRKDGTFLINNEPISFSYKATEDLYVIALFYNGMSDEDKKSLQIEISDEPTTYEPYAEQILTLTSDRPLTKWDKLVEQGGQYGWLYQSVIDSNVKPSRTDLFPNGFSLFKDFGNGVYVYKVTNIKKAIGFQTSLCEQFKNKDGSYSTGDLFCYSDQPSMQMQYFVTDIPTLEEFKTWMEANSLTMVYKTTQTEFVPLSQEEQTQLRNLHSYNGTTNITVDSGEVPCGIKLTYRKEI